MSACPRPKFTESRLRPKGRLPKLDNQCNINCNTQYNMKYNVKYNIKCNAEYDAQHNAYMRAWELIARHMALAISDVYGGININTIVLPNPLEPNKCILSYDPKFILENVTYMHQFGVLVHSNQPQYPLTCSNLTLHSVFTIHNASEWKKHLDKYVLWAPEIRGLVHEIKNVDTSTNLMQYT